MHRSVIILTVTTLFGVFGWLTRPARSTDPLAFLTMVLTQSRPSSGTDYIPVCGLTNVGGIPATVLQQTIPHRADVGTYPTPTSTQVTDAQAFFEQGMAYLHGYSLVEAARSFHQALRADSTLVMAHVGLSRVYSQLRDTPAAWREANRARLLERHASDRQKAHIQVRFSHLKALDSLKNFKLLQTYRGDLEQATRQFPTDAELWLLLGNAREFRASGRGQGSTPAGNAIYEKVLVLAPNHPAAHHYLIHGYEGMMNYEKALVHGEAYARLSPNLPHARHMYAHDLMKIGQVDSAINELDKADSQEETLYKTDHYKPDYDWHHAHNLNLLALCYQYQGRINKARQALRRTYALTTPGRDDWSFYTKRSYPELLISVGRISKAQPMATAMSQAAVPAERLTGHYLLGLIALRQHNMDQAIVEQKAAEAELPAIRKLPYGVVDWVEAYPKFLATLILLNDPAQRGPALDKARAFQKAARRESGPDGWAEALFQLETIASVAQQQGLTEFADESVKLMVEHDPNYPGTHYLLAQTATRNGDTETAKRELALAKQGWHQANANFRQAMALR
jgi:tetratricopeptide (TPR) repeat protein